MSAQGFCTRASPDGNLSVAIYGTSITAFVFPYHMSRVLGLRAIPHMGHPGHGTTRDMLYHENKSIELFDNTSYDVIIISWGIRDHIWGVPWEETKENARLIFKRLRETGADVVFYNQVAQFEEEYGEICRDEGVIFVSNISDIFGNVYLKSDPIHPNEEGYGILAERVAQYLLEAGAIDYAVTCTETEEQIEELFDQVDEMMGEGISTGIPERCMTKINEGYAMAEYLRDNDHCYTAVWELREKLIRPLGSMLEVEGLMEDARVWMAKAVETGISNSTIDRMVARYQSATQNRSSCQFDQAIVDLEWILQTQVPQARFPLFLSLMIFLVFRRAT
jgi:hypothetical protein